MLEKTYNPSSIESKWYEASEEAGAFASAPDEDTTPYAIMMPPPNVTGSLHMGHALTFTLQDVLIRFYRKTGRDVLWQPGMDHAGIATQMVVERQLADENVNRQELGRDKFIKKVWEWKSKSGGNIIHQQRHLGITPDWPRSRFTLDKGLSLAVNRVFVSLHKQNLIYRDKRLVNWDPKLQTAISDLEVEQKEVDGNMWSLHYPLTSNPSKFITVATTRPETMLGDMAVVVNPEDNRYAHLVGETVKLPLVNREIPIIADSYSDIEKGTGAVKITPAHDFNDFEVGRRHKLELINIFDAHACINESAPKRFRGLDRFVARKKILEELDALGLLGEVVPNKHSVPHGDRSGVILEPWLMDQWYVDAQTLAKPAIKAVETGKTRFVPQHWEKTYFEWMHNIQPWCVSRQLWWGHRIPAWYGPDGTAFVEETEEEAQNSAKLHYGRDIELYRDEDVLDTWFSSALWPFSTLGWPQSTSELSKYYPGNVLVTGFDIIFFWVARMMMMSMHFMDGEVPFKDVYIHALVRDEHGQKMSKSKGNVLDPLDLTQKYGSDALRFTLTAMAAQGRDLKLSETKIEGYRNFATKIWNAARFLEFHSLNGAPQRPENVTLLVNKWILRELDSITNSFEDAISGYRFNEAADKLYHFIWNLYCDWYIEFIKPDLDESQETRKIAPFVLYQAMQLLNPIMPFITEELNKRIFESDNLLITSSLPTPTGLGSGDTQISMVIDLITAIRAVRSEMNIPLSSKPQLLIRSASNTQIKVIESMKISLLKLARIEKFIITQDEFPKETAISNLHGFDIGLPLKGILDFEAEVARLNKEISVSQSEIDKISKKLSNEGFVNKAPSHVVEENKKRLVSEQGKVEALQTALRRLS